MLEKRIEQAFVKAARRRGWLALKLAGLGVAGFPDRTVLMPGGKVVFLEFKRPGQKATALQLRWLKTLQSLGFTAEVVTSSKEAIACCTSTNEKP